MDVNKLYQSYVDVLTEAGYTITPPPEPKMVEVDFWVNIYSDARPGTTFSSKKEADSWQCAANRIACINIKRTVTVGEGL